MTNSYSKAPCIGDIYVLWPRVDNNERGKSLARVCQTCQK